MTGPAQHERRFREACRAVARALVPPARKQALRGNDRLSHLVSRFSTLHVVLSDEIEALAASRARSDALALILAADFAWQVIRALSDRRGDDAAWLASVLPPNHAQIDAEVGNGHFAQQVQIVADATWVFELHSALRHPQTESPTLLPFLREPVPDDASSRLLDAARAIRQVLLSVQVALDPTVTVT